MIKKIKDFFLGPQQHLPDWTYVSSGGNKRKFKNRFFKRLFGRLWPFVLLLFIKNANSAADYRGYVGSTITVNGSVTVIASGQAIPIISTMTLSVSCTNCSPGGGGDTYTHLVSSGSSGDPLYVRAQSTVTVSVNNFPATQAVSGSFNQNSYTVTAGSGTFSTSGSFNQNSYTVTAGSGTFATSGANANSFTVTPGTGAWMSAIANSITVTPGTGTFTTSGAFNQNSYTVTPGSGTFVTSGSFNQNSYTVTAGTGAWASPILNSVTVTPGSGTFATSGAFNQNSYTVTPGTGTFSTASAAAVTFIAYSTKTNQANTVLGCLLNATGSTVILKVRQIELFTATEATVTGVTTNFTLHRSTFCNNIGNTVITSNIAAADTNDATLNASVSLSSGTQPLSFGAALGSVVVNPDETAGTAPETNIYRFAGVGEKPLTLRAAQAVLVRQGAAASSGGTTGVRFIFTQE